jgi:hypothetical protein
MMNTKQLAGATPKGLINKAIAAYHRRLFQRAAELRRLLDGVLQEQRNHERINEPSYIYKVRLRVTEKYVSRKLHAVLRKLNYWTR